MVSGMNGIQPALYVAASDMAARTRLAADPTHQRAQAFEAAAHLERKHETTRIGVDGTDEPYRVKPRNEDERQDKQHEHPGTYDEHGRRDDDDVDDEPHPHLDLTA